MAKSQKISLCMIVKDEEEWIEQCIKSVKSIVFEIIVVDTGSTDKTIEIAMELGAKVFTQDWDDDFSKARNFSIEKATGDWILILDADEAIAERDLKALKKLATDRSVCWEFLQRHYSDDHRLSEYTPVTGEYPEWEKGNKGYFESNCVRMFPNRDNLVYEGRVHELVEHSIKKIGKHKIKRTPIRIQHYGHTEKVRQKKNKSKIYTPLGVEKLKDAPIPWQAHFELGVEHNQNGRHAESVAAFLQSLALAQDYVPSWVNMGYVLCEMRRYKLAEFSLISAIELEPRNDEAFCNLGVVYMRTNQLPKAEAVLRRAVEINPKYVNAACNLGKTLAMQKKLSEAVLIYRQILAIMPRCVPAKADLGSIYLSQRMFAEAEVYLKSALQDDPAQSRIHLMLGQVLQSTMRVSEAVKELEQFVALERARGTLPPDDERLVSQVESRLPVLRQQAPAA